MWKMVQFSMFFSTMEVNWKQVGNFQVFFKYGQIIKNVAISEKNMVNTTYIAKKHGQRQPHTYISASQSGQPAIQPASQPPTQDRQRSSRSRSRSSKQTLARCCFFYPSQQKFRSAFLGLLQCISGFGRLSPPNTNRYIDLYISNIFIYISIIAQT